MISPGENFDKAIACDVIQHHSQNALFARAAGAASALKTRLRALRLARSPRGTLGVVRLWCTLETPSSLQQGVRADHWNRNRHHRHTRRRLLPKSGDFLLIRSRPRRSSWKRGKEGTSLGSSEISERKAPYRPTAHCGLQRGSPMKDRVARCEQSLLAPRWAWPNLSPAQRRCAAEVVSDSNSHFVEVQIRYTSSSVLKSNLVMAGNFRYRVDPINSFRRGDLTRSVVTT